MPSKHRHNIEPDNPSLESIIFRTKKKFFHLMHGEHESIFGGRGMSFREVREYSSEDDIRHINWKMTARTGTPMVNLYNETKQIPIVLVYLNSAGLHFGQNKSKRDTTIEVLCSLSYATLSKNDILSTLFHSHSNNHWLKPSRNRGAVKVAFDTACSLNNLGEHIDFAALSKHIIQKTKRKSLLFLIGDFWEFDKNHDLGELAFLYELHCIIVRDKAEEDITLRGNYHITDPLTQKSHSISIDKKSADRYKTLALEHEHMLQNHFSNHKIKYTKIYTHEDAIDRLAQFVRQ